MNLINSTIQMSFVIDRMHEFERYFSVVVKFVGNNKQCMPPVSVYVLNTFIFNLLYFHNSFEQIECKLMLAIFDYVKSSMVSIARV